MIRLCLLFPAVLFGQPCNLVNQWTFNDGTANDYVGGADGVIYGGAVIANGSLFLNNSANSNSNLTGQYIRAELSQTLTSKTLVTWTTYTSAELTQGGGTPLSLELDNGSDFDAVDYGERTTYQWLAGSGNFRRTPANNGGALESSTLAVMMAIVYYPNNTIVLYRNGVLYASYTQGTLLSFPGNASHALIGLRHDTCPTTCVNHNCWWNGAIDEVRIYNCPLTAAQLQQMYTTGPVSPSASSAPSRSSTVAPTALSSSTGAPTGSVVSSAPTNGVACTLALGCLVAAIL